MKEISYKTIDDYVKMSKNYSDPKVVRIYEIVRDEEGKQPQAIKAVTFLRTFLFQWRGTVSNDVIEILRNSGHLEGDIKDVIPLGKYLG